MDQRRLATVPPPAQHRALSCRRNHDLEGRTLDAASLESGGFLLQYNPDHELDVADHYHW
jgi:hypothetical protein